MEWIRDSLVVYAEGRYPGEVGWLLRTFYDRADAEALVSGGGVSRLGPDSQTWKTPLCVMITTPRLPCSTAAFPAT